jgi:hypothetical protein
MWKQVSWFVICKPGNDDYTKLKVYRSISQLSRLGQDVEKVAVEQLAEEAGRS